MLLIRNNALLTALTMTVSSVIWRAAPLRAEKDAVLANNNSSRSLLAAAPSSLRFDSQWKTGRATWYGGPGPDGAGPDGMSIFTGSCGLGNNLPAPFFVAAAQTMGGYDYGLTDQCGRCFEVACVDGPTRGLADSVLGPWKGCQFNDRTVIVKITDSCPCNHPNQGNKRWCCGDALHLDLSYSAFGAIAKMDKGVVDLKIRAASCDLWGKVIHYGPPIKPSSG